MSLSINPINHSYEEVIAKLSKQIEKDDMVLKKQKIQKAAYKINKENEELRHANFELDQKVFDLEKDNTNLEKEKERFDDHLKSYNDLIYENNINMKEKDKIIETKDKELEIAIKKIKSQKSIIRDYQSKQVSPCDYFKAFAVNFPRFFATTYSYCIDKIFPKQSSLPKKSTIIKETIDTVKGAKKIIKLTQTVGRL